MGTARRWAVVLCTLCVLVSLVGCDGVDGEVSLTVGADGGLQEHVVVDGVLLESDDLAALRESGWTIDVSKHGFSASRECTTAAGFGEGQSDLVGAIFRGAGRAEIAADTQVTQSTTDYFFVELHTVEIALPRLDFEPTECSYCGGSGATSCPDCSGAGFETCSDCAGAGFETCSDCAGAGSAECSSCGGDGVLEGYYWQNECWSCGGTGRADCWNCDAVGRLECWTCEGVGQLECWTCGSSGEVYCDQCGGTGEPAESDVQTYQDALDSSSLRINIQMPGRILNETNPLSWEFEGEEIEDLDMLSASSWVVDWLRTGIALAVLTLVLALLTWLIVRGIRRMLSNSRATREARRAASLQVTPAAAADSAGEYQASSPGGKFCRYCGSAMGASSQFCPRCGKAASTVSRGEGD